jgi:hypothetical protein
MLAVLMDHQNKTQILKKCEENLSSNLALRTNNKKKSLFEEKLLCIQFSIYRKFI